MSEATTRTLKGQIVNVLSVAEWYERNIPEGETVEWAYRQIAAFESLTGMDPYKTPNAAVKAL